MPTTTWDPGQYLRYADARSRPFFDLLSQVRADAPRRVVDAGCGPGNLTVTLAERWPAADVVGFDSSPSMIEQAAARGGARVRFAVADATTWIPDAPIDVLVSNALLQWIDGHDALAVRWLELLAPGGWLAFQVPGNFDSPSHLAIAEQVAEPRWRDALPPGAMTRPGSFSPEHYLQVLTDAGAVVDAWETTYLHVLPGDDPVLEWVQGTALRPILGALGAGPARAEFLAELARRLRDAYQRGPHGTVFPFRRIFVVAQRSLAETDRG
jgi:trans-aconitate 2-methyltransferase